MVFSLRLTPVAYAAVQTPIVTDGSTGTTAAGPSARLIVELNSPPLAAAYLTAVSAAAVNGKLDANTAAAQAYSSQLQAEQAVFVRNMQAVLAGASVATFVNEANVTEAATYQIVFNGLAINPGASDREMARQILVRLPGVKNVYYDVPHYTQLYISTALINAPAIWNAVGGRANGGAGIKVASMDGGVHHRAPMMNGAGYTYPPGYGPNGLGLTANNNGKIIASRAYFRDWDPPAPGDENPWPGVAGTSHGMHTSSTAAGDIVSATYNGFNVGTISGVAPKAYVMSYRVFYASVNGIGSFYTTEGLAALEDIVQDGADVVNNSWGSGPGSTGGSFDPLDQALINVTKAGIFVSMANGNAGPSTGTSDHPLSAYINVAASTTGGALGADQIIGFSSRGPGVGGTLKPDIAAPGVNILAQGYTPGVTGEAIHLGYGKVSGTSMAAPHVAGAAAMLKQIHPDWSVAAIKSALMSTAKYIDIYNFDGSPAQPLDMGAGRLDLTNAANPGVILDPPSLSFGFIPTGTQKTLSVTVTSVATATETYNLSTLYTGDGFAPTQTTALPGITANLTVIRLNPGESKTIQVTFDTAAGSGIGDNQGYLVMDGANYDAHMAAWARVTPAAVASDVLLIDGDFSTIGPGAGFPLRDYRWYYTDSLEQLGYRYTVLDYGTEPFPAAATLAGYPAIVYFTGENYVGGAGLSDPDMDTLVEYMNAGGSVVVMGQDMAATIGADDRDADAAHFFYYAGLGANWIGDSVSAGVAPEDFIRPAPSAPAFLQDMAVDLTLPQQLVAAGPLSGTQEVPPVATLTAGEFAIFHNIDRNYTEFVVTVTPSTTQPITLTGMHIHVGDVGANGPVIRDLAALGGLTLPRPITSTVQVSGIISSRLTVTEVAQAVADGLYINVHTTNNLGGEIRGQIEPTLVNNQQRVDEIDNRRHNGEESPVPGDGPYYPGLPILTYAGPYNSYNGTVAIAHGDQPSLESPGITYLGRSIYATFGLEGMNNAFRPTPGFTPTTRSELLGAFLDWNWSQPPTTVQISHTVAMSSSLHIFAAQAAYGVQPRRVDAISPQTVQYRWDFGDGSPYVISSSVQAGHRYLCGTLHIYAVRAEITDNYGNVVIGSQEVDVSHSCAINVGPDTMLYLPIISK